MRIDTMSEKIRKELEYAQDSLLKALRPLSGDLGVSKIDVTVDSNNLVPKCDVTAEIGSSTKTEQGEILFYMTFVNLMHKPDGSAYWGVELVESVLPYFRDKKEFYKRALAHALRPTAHPVEFA